jgi:hypothetical protein
LGYLLGNIFLKTHPVTLASAVLGRQDARKIATVAAIKTSDRPKGLLVGGGKETRKTAKKKYWRKKLCSDWRRFSLQTK